MRTLFWMLSLREQNSVAAPDEETILPEKIELTGMEEADTSDSVSASTVIDHGPLKPRKFKCRVKKLREKAVTAVKKLFATTKVIENVNGFYETRTVYEGKGYTILKVGYHVLVAFAAGLIVGLVVFCALAVAGGLAF
jgi:hypothetical protein